KRPLATVFFKGEWVTISGFRAGLKPPENLPIYGLPVSGRHAPGLSGRCCTWLPVAALSSSGPGAGCLVPAFLAHGRTGLGQWLQTTGQLGPMPRKTAHQKHRRTAPNVLSICTGCV